MTRLSQKFSFLGCLLVMAALLGSCTGQHDPTQIMLPGLNGPPSPLAHGVNLTIVRAGDYIPAVINVWVESVTSAAGVKTLLT